MKQYPAIFRERLLRFIDAGHSAAEAARIFGVSLSSIARWRTQQHASGDLTPRPRPGRTPRIGPAQAAALDAQLAALPDATLAEHCARWQQDHGVAYSIAGMSRVLRRHGHTHKKSPVRR